MSGSASAGRPRPGDRNSPGRRSRPFIVGLTGGIATGKSTVADLLAEMGAAVVSADAIARDVVEPGEPALEEIRLAFGPGVIAADGTLDRAAMRRLVFSDTEAKRRLESITHPAIRARAEREVERFRAHFDREGAPAVIVLEVPLLYEAGKPWIGMVDRVVVVWAPRHVQLARLVAERGLSQAEADRMIRAQMSTDVKAARADDVIRNEGAKEELRTAVCRLWERWGLS